MNEAIKLLTDFCMDYQKTYGVKLEDGCIEQYIEKLNKLNK